MNYNHPAAKLRKGMKKSFINLIVISPDPRLH